MTARLAIGMALLALGGCTKPPYPRGTVETLYPAPPRPDVRQHPVAGRSLQVVEMPGIEGGTPILFVHGSPGDWQAWARYLDTADLPRAGARRAVDRPGFGGSGPGRVITDLRAQAALLAGLIADDGPPAVVVGHLLGGPLVAWMAIDFPEKVCGAVMVAGSVAPELEAEPPAGAGRAGVGHDLAGAVAARAGLRDRERPLRGAHLPGAAAGAADRSGGGHPRLRLDPQCVRGIGRDRGADRLGPGLSQGPV